MKKTVTILLLFVFVLQQTLPILQTFFGDDVVLVTDMLDEKKVDKEESKLKKDYLYIAGKLSSLMSRRVNAQFHLAESIKAHPRFDILTPPPDLY